VRVADIEYEVDGQQMVGHFAADDGATVEEALG
jgi:hypothetical protein